MPLPEGFSEWEHLQDMIRLEHNKVVRAYFKNQADDDVSTPKAALKHACLLKDQDTVSMTLLRQWLFEVTIGHLQSVQTPVYGIPVPTRQSVLQFKPQVLLYFKESHTSEAVRSGLAPATAEISFRLVNETSETIARPKAESLAKKIKEDLATPPFTWEKGKYVCTYIDEARGYRLRLHVKNQAEGEMVVKKILSIQDHVFNDTHFQFVDNRRAYPPTPGTHRVYGRTVKKMRERPSADVKFCYAQLLIWGQQNAVNLVSIGGRFKSVIERV
jgi:hypothetical protein